MSRPDSSNLKLPKGVSALLKPRWGRPYRASIRTGKGVEVHLGLYRNPWLAGMAYNQAAELLKKPHPPLQVPTAEALDAEEVRAIAENVRRRLGLVKGVRKPPEEPPSPSELVTLFEVVVVPFWRSEASSDHGDQPGSGLEAAAWRLVDSARILFWSRAAGHPTPVDAMSQILSRRLELAFRRSDLTREVLDDDGDTEIGLARWLVYPDEPIGAHAGFRAEIATLYVDILHDAVKTSSAERPSWAILLDLDPPYRADRVRSAFLAKTRHAHPDAGGTDAAFVRLREAYQEAMNFCQATRSN